jgi:FAD/FMN-containing dehydrogenase
MRIRTLMASVPISTRSTVRAMIALVGGAAASGAFLARHVAPTGQTLEGVDLITPSGGPQTLNDALRLSETPIHRHIIVQDDPGEALLAALRRELRDAASENRTVNIGAARHSMGGQAIPREGHAITFESSWVQPGVDTYQVHAGARWQHVIAALHAVDLAPKVMQANNNFGVAATFSVNAHGWATPFGPMGSTVRSIRILLADGSHVTASKTENSDIFAAAMGGYGLIGLITDLEVEAVPAALYEPIFEQMPADAFAAAFQAKVQQAPMAYGRLNVDRDGFFDDALLLSYIPTDGERTDPNPPGALISRIKNSIFRYQTENEWAKRRRWGLETGIAPLIAGPVTRSALMNEPTSSVLRQTDLRRTDIIHEYFVAPEQFNAFLAACREIISNSYQELLNITLRWVEQDSFSLLSYAPKGPRIASVLSFSQEMTARAEMDMTQMTRQLIDAVHAIGGNYYLPYRPHATPAQFAVGYVRAPEFAALKRSLDPKAIFGNALWNKYISPL